MAEFTLRVVYRQSAWRGFFDGFEDPETQALTCYPSRLNFQPKLDIRYDTDPGTPIVNTILTDATYGFVRVLTVDI